jgi:pSer/pThr/pTyr-binding forkhead associated (FHA) protein
MIKVYIANGPETGRFFALKDKIALIGRGSDNSIRIDEKSVSRIHVKVLREKDKYYIEDLKSRNGTWISGNAIDAGRRVEVQQGVPVALGNVLISLGKKCPLDQLPNQYSINIVLSKKQDPGIPLFHRAAQKAKRGPGVDVQRLHGLGENARCERDLRNSPGMRHLLSEENRQRTYSFG